MASLAEQHRKAQLAVRAQSLRDLLKLWPVLDLERISDTWPALETALLLLIRKHGSTSSGISRAFYQRIRRQASVPGIATPTAAAPDEEVIIRGLRVVGPANAAFQLSKGALVQTVAKNTLVNLSGEVSRHVLDHGRMSLTESLVKDQERNDIEVGVERVTSGSPCDWCAQQASETYPPTERFPAHMHCSCYPNPVFR